MKNEMKLLLFLVFFPFINSCNTSPPINNPVSLKKVPVNNTKVYFAPLEGKIGGKLTGINLSVNINHLSFKTKASSNGQVQGKGIDIKSYKVFLINNNTNPLTATKANGAEFTLNTLNVGSTDTVTFTNVPVGTWFAAVEAWNGPAISGQNITAPVNYGAEGILKLAVSSNSVTVNNDLTLSPSGVSLQVPLQLQNAIGVNIDSQVTIVNGVNYAPYNALPQTSAINEFLANTYITSEQAAPAISANNNGNSVIVWQSAWQDGDDWGIFAQRVDSGSTPQGIELAVNTTSTGIQENPSVAVDNAGNFIIAWNGNGVGDSDGVFARRFDSSGNPLGPEFLVNTYTLDTQRRAKVAADSLGNFVITWESQGQDGSNYGIYAQRFDSNGIFQGSEFQINDTTAQEQQMSAVAMDNNGNFNVTWSSDSSGNFDIMAKRYASTGSATSGEFLVNTGISDNEQFPAIAVADNDNFVITWFSDKQDGIGYGGIYAQMFNNDGSFYGSEFRANTYTFDYQQNPTLAMDNDGNFIIGWQSAGQDGSGDGIFAQRYASTGSATGGEFKVNGYTTNAQITPAVAMDGNGAFIFAWNSSFQDGSYSGIYAKRYNSN